MPLDPAKIRARRARLRLSQTEAARRAGVSQPHWSEIECGARPQIQLTTAEAIATALRCALTDLLRAS